MICLLCWSYQIWKVEKIYSLLCCYITHINSLEPESTLNLCSNKYSVERVPIACLHTTLQASVWPRGIQRISLVQMVANWAISFCLKNDGGGAIDVLFGAWRWVHSLEWGSGVLTQLTWYLWGVYERIGQSSKQHNPLIKRVLFFNFWWNSKLAPVLHIIRA